jgi:Flp pilus assembly protein TadD
VRADPSYAPARLYLGAVLVKLGEKDEARRQLRRYLKLDPSGDCAPVARRLFRELSA